MTLLEILNLVQILALMVITGGTLVIGALAAPTLFSNLSREEAGSIMIELFGKFDSWIKVSALSVITAKLLEIIFIAKFNFIVTTGTGEEISKALNMSLINSSILVLAITAISLHIAYRLSPAIIESFEDDSAQFSALHKQSEMLHRVNFVLGVFLLTNFI